MYTLTPTSTTIINPEIYYSAPSILRLLLSACRNSTNTHSISGAVDYTQNSGALSRQFGVVALALPTILSMIYDTMYHFILR
ncbi:hypothetical protein L873DRAFT_111241 [Choiromyces venosus 120613-1]|uniref:Uncharacterized protein n=1 Tax=Choiromyces venosus 120613-1 TaxID=1336337 RepID=A0A3N4J3Z4_9PEZI|nr:hypothetical protein L873DRAFT_111241 [Choiromyces venosus 120613-1]